MAPKYLPLPAHDRSSVRKLHQAYADKVESFFQGLRRLPDDPCNVRIQSFGTARTAIAHGHDWLNRATLTGDEDLALVDEIVEYFAAQGERCHIEWNPGNCYRSGTWNDELARHLLMRDFRPGGFRCVWEVGIEPESTKPDLPPTISVRHFADADREDFLEIVAQMDRLSEADRKDLRKNVCYGEGDPRWHHYVAYLNGSPGANSTLFTGMGIAYLEWGRTLEACRGRGLHGAMIRRRLDDARAAKCATAFAVTDIGIASARNLQRVGFRLAYNYVMLVRDPKPLGNTAASKPS